MEQFTPEQAAFLALLIAFISPIFQTIKRLVALPWPARALAWIYARLKWVPGNSNTWQRIALYGLATLIGVLFKQSSLIVPFPGDAPVFDVTYGIVVLTWALTMLRNAAGFVGLVTIIYNLIYKDAFKAAGKADIPVLRELAPGVIKAATKEATS